MAGVGRSYFFGQLITDLVCDHFLPVLGHKNDMIGELVYGMRSSVITVHKNIPNANICLFFPDFSAIM